MLQGFYNNCRASFTGDGTVITTYHGQCCGLEVETYNRVNNGYADIMPSVLSLMGMYDHFFAS
jgi:hypothetical protein